MSTRPPLSVVLATTDPWPDLERCLAVLSPQIQEHGAELFVGDGHGDALDPQQAAESPWLSLIRRPGASVFDLRAEAASRARGEIVALTEDHCLVGRDWCTQILEAFRRFPDADAVTGPVWNGSPERLIDRANYLHTFGATLPPYDDPRRRYRSPAAANLAFRRALLPSGALRPGWMELDLVPSLWRERRFGMHEAMQVTHVQSPGFLKTIGMHFDNGRTTTGLRGGRYSRSRLPWPLFRHILSGFSTNPAARAAARPDLPAVLLLSCAHSLGELVGSLAGPGGSPARLR